MRIVIAVLFWVGLILTAREWLYARKYGLAITRPEKLYLAMALPLIFGARNSCLTWWESHHQKGQ